MVKLFVAGAPVGVLADAVRVLAEGIAKNQSVEFRDEAGAVVGAFVPTPPPTPTEPLIPWEPGVTQDEIDRRMAEPGFTFEEVKKRLGWE